MITPKQSSKYVKWKNPRIYQRKCKTCGNQYKTTQQNFFECPDCWSARLESYDPDLMIDFIGKLLSYYVMQQEFKVRCPKCRRIHLVSKRAFFHNGALCNRCSLSKIKDI